MTTSVQNKDLFASLKTPFASKDVEWKIGSSNKDKTRGRALPYLKFKAVADRLDDVLGEANWKAEYVAGPAGGVVCRLSVRVDGEWICKENGAENTDFEGVKGGLTDAFKRAATMWGVGRYLHAYEALWVDIEAQTGKFQIPALPDDMLPAAEVEANAKLAGPLSTTTKETTTATGASTAGKVEPESSTVASKPSKPSKPEVKEADAKAEAESVSPSTAQVSAEKRAEVTETSVAPVVAASPDAAAEKVAEPAAQAQAQAAEATDASQPVTDSAPVRPTDLPEAQVKRITQLEERIAKNVPTSVIREYVNGPKSLESMVEAARAYILACLDQKDRELAEMNNSEAA